MTFGVLVGRGIRYRFGRSLGYIMRLNSNLIELELLDGRSSRLRGWKGKLFRKGRVDSV